NKNIPDAAGLGGGSADAAGVILALNKIYSANLSEEELLNIALKCGADVPFCIKGGTKRVKGIGEKLIDCPPFRNCFIIIAKNGTKPSTAEMYKCFDEIKNPKTADNDAFLKSLECENTEEALKFAENSFEAVTGLYGIDEIISSTNPLKVSLSGSGPSVFAVYKDEESAALCLALLKEKNITAIKTTPADKSVIFE
ncbi:MAG: 4-(cytidine 5'-diphospho)-2-C-methyl-D-erythritol kinase, partial [Oscillospiraceae bacterium]|nr:4-(cytidine 5'-diphospho)-2-C-methyl-D-erythritol kinase [Oscillospiraceae bacterium]